MIDPATLDLRLLSAIDSQTTDDDKRSLLALHAAAARLGEFEYLEIGSHLGGSLQALIRDPRCTRIVSIDSRPGTQPDERGHVYAYPQNSTSRMLEALSNLPDADLSKLVTIDGSTEALASDDVPGAPAVCFVDGEHTDEAVLRDARFCREVLGDRAGVIAFHDSWIVFRGIRRFLSEVDVDRVALLPESVVAVAVNGSALLDDDIVRGQIDAGAWGYLGSLERLAAYRDALQRPLPRILRRLRLIRV